MILHDHHVTWQYHIHGLYHYYEDFCGFRDYYHNPKIDYLMIVIDEICHDPFSLFPGVISYLLLK